MKVSKQAWVVIAAIAIFALWKLSLLSFRFGDENVYFYMTHAIASGLLPYRDFFIADPPFFILLLSAYKWLIGEHLLLFKVWPIALDSLSAILLYRILRARNVRVAALGPVLYLFSFSILSTSDYVTGAELTIFFLLAALHTDLRSKPYWSGVFWALSCLCKLYAAPALIGFLAYKLFKREFRELGQIILAGSITTLIVLLPFALIAPHNLYYDLITHQFNRPAGLNKWNVWGYFGRMEWALALLALVGAFFTRHRATVVMLAFTIFFFLLYRDLYYLYLHMLLPFFALLAAESLGRIQERYGNELLGATLAVYALVWLYPFVAYLTGVSHQGVFSNAEEVAAAVAEAPENYPVYGIQEVAPLAALMAGRHIFANIIDTNTQNFAAGTHDKASISERAVENGIYLITRDSELLYFDTSLFEQFCTPYRSLRNNIEIYSCYSSSS